MRFLLGVLGVVLVTVGGARGAYLLEIDVDGVDDGVLTLNPNFQYGGDTIVASQSSPSTAFGTSGADSIFGGDGVLDTYVYRYSPDSMVDNLVVGAGQSLGDGNFATGKVGGLVGVYAVYATWPFSSNVSGGLTNFEVVAPGDGFSAGLDQTAGGAGSGNEWFKLGEVDYTGGEITVTQTPAANTFVSMRAYGLLFEAVPEPSGTVLVLLGALMLLCRRRGR